MPFTAAAVGTAGLTAGGAAAANIAVGAIIAGTAVSVAGQRQQAEADKAIAEANAAQFEVKAEQEEQIAREEQRVITKEGERQKARLRVLAGNAGIDLVGTPLLNVAEVGGEVERQRLQAGQGGRGRAFDLRFRGTTERVRGRNIRTASRFRTGTSLLTGARQLATIGTAASR